MIYLYNIYFEYNILLYILHILFSFSLFNLNV